jgi:hypothetical protein
MSTLTDLQALSESIERLPIPGTDHAAQEAALYLADRAFRQRLLQYVEALEQRIAALEHPTGFLKDYR